MCKFVNEKGEEEVRIRKRPSWRGFEELLDETGLKAGECLKRLREIYGLSREKLAKKIGISVHKLSQIERSEDLERARALLYTRESLSKYLDLLHTHEKMLKKIFRGIVAD